MFTIVKTCYTCLSDFRQQLSQAWVRKTNFGKNFFDGFQWHFRLKYLLKLWKVVCQISRPVVPVPNKRTAGLYIFPTVWVPHHLAKINQIIRHCWTKLSPFICNNNNILLMPLGTGRQWWAPPMLSRSQKVINLCRWKARLSSCNTYTGRWEKDIWLFANTLISFWIFEYLPIYFQTDPGSARLKATGHVGWTEAGNSTCWLPNLIQVR